MKRLADANALSALRETLQKEAKTGKPLIIVSGGTCGFAQGAKAVVDEFNLQLNKGKLLDKVDMRVTGCHGFCGIEPIVIVQPSKKSQITYCRVAPKDITEILTNTVKNGTVIERLLYEDSETGERITYENDIPFYKYQTRIITGDNKEINPVDIETYIRIGGYSALPSVLSEIKPDEVIDIIKSSGLRGRGGAGFPTGRKWELCRSQKEKVKYVICNADEGDPGAYMDRSILESNPHSVLEGMIIGAYAIGANEGKIYLRVEYPLAVKHMEIAIAQAGELGLLGENILGSGFNFDIDIIKGAGAFVCGEETALIASIEGKRGVPRPKPPYPAQEGLWGKPTNINNVETWANVPKIINKGAEWFFSIGTETSKGTKIFSLVGKVQNTGLVEVPMGMTLGEIVNKIGGGIKGGKKFKAIQIGGPSGGCVPQKHLDKPVDFDQLTKIGSMMGSGGMIVLDEDTCMVDFARYFLNFLKDESCGKCTSCREGLTQMHGILTDITEDKATEADIDILYDLAKYVKVASLCQLGKTSPNPALTTLSYFKDEYIAHIRDKRCPAGVCLKFFHYEIDPNICKGCGICLDKCPTDAIKGEKKKAHTIDLDKCIKCGNCYESCKFEAIIKVCESKQ